MAVCNKADITAKLTKAFQEVDRDHNGTLEPSELEMVLKSYYKSVGKQADQSTISKEVASFVKEVDKNHDNKISLDEFVKYFLQFCSK